MKKITIITVFIFLSLVSFSQKIGHINVEQLMSLMPERDKAISELENYAKDLQSQLSAMESEYQSMIEDYQNNESSYDDLTKQDKLTEIQNLQQRIATFQQSANTSLQNKELELIKPMEEKAINAINKVAIRGKYTYILNSSLGVLLYHDDSEDILSKVKKELGL